jgi:hypothetical protein
MANVSMPATSKPKVALRSRGARVLRVSALGALGALVAVLTGCATTQAPADTGLSGQWQLDAAASDNVPARVTRLIAQAEARLRKRLRSGYGAANPVLSRDQGGDAGGSAVLLPMPVVGPDFQQLRTHLLQLLTAPASLSLQVQPDTVTIQSDHLPANDYQPGESFVRFDEYGNATVSSGWSGQAFVVRHRYLSSGALTERYEVDPKSGILTYTRDLKDPTVGPIELKSIYHHG